MITADHGNAEQMYSEKGGPHTAHTTNRGTYSSETPLKLPFIYTLSNHSNLKALVAVVYFPTQYPGSLGMLQVSKKET